MPNWCSTLINFKGNPDAIKTLHDFISDDKANKEIGLSNDFGYNWLGNYLHRAGLNYENYRCRGTVCDIQKIDDEGTSFHIWTETAWAPMLAMWQAIIDKIAPGIEIIYSSSECGCSVYWTNDPSFADKYIVDLYDEDVLEDNVVEALSWDDCNEVPENELRETLLSILNADKSMDDLIEELEDLVDNDGVSIHKWDFVPVEDVD